MDQTIVNRLSRLKSEHNRLSTQIDLEQKNIVRLETKIKVIEVEKSDLLKVQILIDKAVSVISANGIGRIEAIVTAGLRQVFGNRNNLCFVIEKKDGKRGNVYRLKVRKTKKDGKVVQGDILKSFGGGISNVVSFLLRVMMIKKFGLAKFIVLDEAFNNVSPNYQGNVSAMLKTLCDKHGYTILAITNQTILGSAAHAIYKAQPQDDRGELPPVLHLVIDQSELEDLDGKRESVEETQSQVSGRDNSPD